MLKTDVRRLRKTFVVRIFRSRPSAFAKLKRIVSADRPFTRIHTHVILLAIRLSRPKWKRQLMATNSCEGTCAVIPHTVPRAPRPPTLGLPPFPPPKVLTPYPDPVYVASRGGIINDGKSSRRSVFKVIKQTSTSKVHTESSGAQICPGPRWPNARLLVFSRFIVRYIYIFIYVYISMERGILWLRSVTSVYTRAN